MTNIVIDLDIDIFANRKSWEPERAPKNSFVPVQLESPFRGINYEHTEFNKKYAEACLRDCLQRGETAMASHLLFTGATDDMIPEERAMGIEAGLKFLEFASCSVVYIDLGISFGMRQGIKRAKLLNKLVVYRTLPKFNEFLDKNSNLLNGHSHIVGRVKEYSLKDDFIDTLMKSTFDNRLFDFEFDVNSSELYLDNEEFHIDFIDDDLNLMYPIFNAWDSRFMNGWNEDKYVNLVEYENKFIPFKNNFDKFKLNRKLKNSFSEKEIKKQKVKKI